MFCDPEWIYVGLEISDANGEPIEYEDSGRMGGSVTIAPFRLAPGEFVEVPGESIAIGRQEEYYGDQDVNYPDGFINTGRATN